VPHRWQLQSSIEAASFSKTLAQARLVTRERRATLSAHSLIVAPRSPAGRD
jgi:hypothetical protein